MSELSSAKSPERAMHPYVTSFKRNITKESLSSSRPQDIVASRLQLLFDVGLIPKDDLEECGRLVDKYKDLHKAEVDDDDKVFLLGLKDRL